MRRLLEATSDTQPFIICATSVRGVVEFVLFFKKTILFTKLTTKRIIYLLMFVVGLLLIVGCVGFRSLMMFSFRCRLGVKALAYGVDAFISVVVVVELGYTPSDVLQQIGRCVVGRRDLLPNFHAATIVFVNTTQHIASMLKRSIESPSSSSLSSSFESLKRLYQQRSSSSCVGPSSSSSSLPVTSLMSTTDLLRYAKLIDSNICMRTSIELARLGDEASQVDVSMAAPTCHQLGASLCDCCRRSSAPSTPPFQQQSIVRRLVEVAKPWADRQQAQNLHVSFLSQWLPNAHVAATFCSSCNVSDHKQVFKE